MYLCPQKLSMKILNIDSSLVVLELMLLNRTKVSIRPAQKCHHWSEVDRVPAPAPALLRTDTGAGSAPPGPPRRYTAPAQRGPVTFSDGTHPAQHQQRGQRSAGTNPAPPGGHSGFWLLLYLFLLSLLLSFAARNTNQIKIFCVTQWCNCATLLFSAVCPATIATTPALGPSPPKSWFTSGLGVIRLKGTRKSIYGLQV